VGPNLSDDLAIPVRPRCDDTTQLAQTPLKHVVPLMLCFGTDGARVRALTTPMTKDHTQNFQCACTIEPANDHSTLIMPSDRQQLHYTTLLKSSLFATAGASRGKA
jgi:hypothetical protein